MVVCLGISAVSGWLASAAAQEKSAATNGMVPFDIPAQPLARALEAYEAATGTVAAYDGTLAVGRISHEVKGLFPPRTALSLLLVESGLAAEYLGDDAFVVVMDPEQAAVVVTAPSTIAAAALSRQDAIQQRYSALVQAGVGRSLCARPETRPGAYRLGLSFWIGASGEVTRLKLLGSTDDHRRDLEIADIVGHLSLGEPPPASMTQPFTMVILPRSSVDCSSIENGDRDG